MNVYSFIGKSGTGKSSNAIQFAYEHNIPAIIDDGLLIVNGHKVAGKSAKYEKTTIAAVKRAIFSSEKHMTEVKNKLEKLNIDRLLIIGTSMKMAKLIAARLNVGKIKSHYYISGFVPSKDILAAQNARKTTGNHVIPIPHHQIGPNILVKIIRKGIYIFSPHKEKIGETTIVQPPFFTRMKEIKDEQVDAISNFTDFQIIQFKIDLIILKQLINNRTNDLIDRIENFIVYWIHQIKDNLIYLKNEFKEFFILQYKKLQTLKLATR